MNGNDTAGTPGISRRTLLGGAAVGALGAVTAAAVPAAADPGQVPDLWHEFTRDPFRHPQIPFVGRAGHGGGAPRLPRPPVVADVRDFGAVADGRTDCAPAINRALAAAGEAGGGTVTVPAGTFRIDGLVRLGHSHVVLRGAGSGRTTLYATKNLTELIGPYGSRYGGDKSSWSWAGGLIWLAPQARWESLTEAIRARQWPFEGWTGNRRDEWRALTAVAPARRGDRTVTVADPAGLRPGALVLLRLADDAGHTLLRHMAGDGPGPAAYTWADKSKLLSYVPYEWPVRVTRVHGHRVTLERPSPRRASRVEPPTHHARTRTDRGGRRGPHAGGGGDAAAPPPARPRPQRRRPPMRVRLLGRRRDGPSHRQRLRPGRRLRVHPAPHPGRGTRLPPPVLLPGGLARQPDRGLHHRGAHLPAPAGTQLHGINVEGLSSYNVWSRGTCAWAPSTATAGCRSPTSAPTSP